VNENFKFNQETEFVPILGLIASQLNAVSPELDDKAKDASQAERSAQAATDIQENHHTALLSLLSDELSVAPKEIHDFEMYVI
jgi:aspartyl aminopeptidase